MAWVAGLATIGAVEFMAAAVALFILRRLQVTSSLLIYLAVRDWVAANVSISPYIIAEQFSTAYALTPPFTSARNRHGQWSATFRATLTSRRAPGVINFRSLSTLFKKLNVWKQNYPCYVFIYTRFPIRKLTPMMRILVRNHDSMTPNSGDISLFPLHSLRSNNKKKRKEIHTNEKKKTIKFALQLV